MIKVRVSDTTETLSDIIEMVLNEVDPEYSWSVTEEEVDGAIEFTIMTVS